MKKGFLLAVLLILGLAAGGWTACRDCHPVTLDKRHAFSCEKCHGGNPRARREETAHRGLVAHPAHPQNWERFCGKCHAREIRRLRKTPHYTLSPAINAVLSAFGLPRVGSMMELPEPTVIRTKADLLYDLLRRRCLKCHLFSSGEDYSEAHRGTGCAACHLLYADGQLVDHRFQPPPSRNCLHCHYGNRVGWDYYGFMAQDLPLAFRSPLVEGEWPPRPWGIEFREMAPDIHARQKIPCRRCHGKKELMEGRSKPSCLACHLEIKGKSPFHEEKILQKVRCSVCHAVWMPRDEGLYFVLYEDPDWEDWQELFVQEDAWVEKLFLEFFQGKVPSANMPDRLSGKRRPGVWFFTLKKRTFEKFVMGWDASGRLSLMRPLLDIHLSYVNAEDELLFENLTPKDSKELPVTPHTTGPGDTFRAWRVLRLLKTRGTHEGTDN